MAGLKAISQYEAVRKHIDAGMSVEQAKNAVAKETGISASTIHTAYYRVARETGVVKPNKGRGTRGVKNAPRERGNGNVTTAVLLERVTDALNALALRMERDERELANLRQIRDLARQS